MSKKNQSVKPWQSRIVGEGEEAPGKLMPNPKNWRIHNAQQQEGLAAVLDRVGWVQRVVVNQRTGRLVDGHMRVALAVRRKDPMVPVVYVDLDEQEETLVLSTLDPIAGLAGTDTAQLKALLEELPPAEDPGLQALLDTIGAACKPEDLGKKGKGEGDEPPEFAPVISYNLIFDDVIQQDLWFSFVKGLKARFTGDTIAAKLTAFLEATEETWRK